MSKLIFIGPGFFVDVMGMLSPAIAEVVLDLHGLKMEGQVEFVLTAQSGKPETKTVTPILSISGIPGPRLPIDQLSNKTGEILQNYKYFSEVMANAWASGFLKFEPD